MAQPTESGQLEAQAVCVGNINPVKLVDKLRLKFGSRFEVHMMHNVYSIRAPKQLSPNEIAECR